MQARTLRDLYRRHQGKVSDKWESYLTAYDTFLREHRKAPIRLLEIGVQNGGSLELWSKYFRRAQIIVGCDVNPACSMLEFKSSKIQMVVGDGAQAETITELQKLSQQFDVIIDDGSHNSEDIIRTFYLLLPLLANGGVYIIEDLHCSYWKGYGGGLYEKQSAMSFLKQLVDVINHAHWVAEEPADEYLASFSALNGLKWSRDDLLKIASIHFRDSLCVVSTHKEDVISSLGPRVVVGEDAPVFDVRSAVPNSIR